MSTGCLSVITSPLGHQSNANNSHSTPHYLHLSRFTLYWHFLRFNLSFIALTELMQFYFYHINFDFTAKRSFFDPHKWSHTPAGIFTSHTPHLTQSFPFQTLNPVSEDSFTFLLQIPLPQGHVWIPSHATSEFVCPRDQTSYYYHYSTHQLSLHSRPTPPLAFMFPNLSPRTLLPSSLRLQNTATCHK